MIFVNITTIALILILTVLFVTYVFIQCRQRLRAMGLGILAALIVSVASAILFIGFPYLVYGSIAAFNDAVTLAESGAVSTQEFFLKLIPPLEEIIKFSCVLGLRRRRPASLLSAKDAMAVGCAFGLLELVINVIGFAGRLPHNLNTSQINAAVVSLGILPVTVVMHGLTCSFFADVNFSRKLRPIGLISAISIHSLYNSVVGPFFSTIQDVTTISHALIVAVPMIGFLLSGLIFTKILFSRENQIVKKWRDSLSKPVVT